MTQFKRPYKLLCTVLVCLLPLFSQAQYSDSTSLPWTSAGPTTFEPAPKAGTRCGSTAYDTRFNGRPQDGAINGYIQTEILCKGHSPYTSCPAGYRSEGAGESGEGLYFFTCSKT